MDLEATDNIGEEEPLELPPRDAPDRRDRGRGRGTYGRRRGRSRSKESRTNGNKVFVENLDYSTTWQSLKDHMKQVGKVRRADVFTGDDNESTGMGMCEFVYAEDVGAAVRKLNNSMLDGRPIHLYTRGGTGMGGPGGREYGDGNVKVWVGNLNWDTRWQDLKDIMRQVGTVEFVKIYKDYQGRSKGSALVEFSDPSEAEAAIEELNDAELDGRRITVREDRDFNSGPRRGGRYKNNYGGKGFSVYVGNIPWEWEWQELKDLAKMYGDVEFVDIPETRDGKSKGFGIVKFANERDGRAAIEDLDGTSHDGRELTVREDEYS